MLEWKVMSGEKKFNKRKRDFEENFEDWFADHWRHKCSRETMLSPQSPLTHIYALMCLPIEDAKLICPSNYYEQCSDCGKSVDRWIETEFSFCEEYGCGMGLCLECAKKLKAEIEKFEQEG